MPTYTCGLPLVLAGLLVACPLWATSPPPSLLRLPAAEQAILRGRDAETGAQLWTESWTLTRRLPVDPPILDVVVEGAGLWETHAAGTWTRQLTIDLWRPDPRLTATEEVRDPQGHPYQRERRDFEYRRHEGRVFTADLLTGASEAKDFLLPPYAIPAELLPFLLRLPPQGAAPSLPLDVVLPTGQVLGLVARVHGHESVQVPAGRYDCLRLDLTPTAPSGGAPSHMWFMATSPYTWVKSREPAHGPGSREVVRELIRLTPARPPLASHDPSAG